MLMMQGPWAQVPVSNFSGTCIRCTPHGPCICIVCLEERLAYYSKPRPWDKEFRADNVPGLATTPSGKEVMFETYQIECSSSYFIGITSNSIDLTYIVAEGFGCFDWVLRWKLLRESAKRHRSPKKNDHQ